jgi:hypothetical protein
LGCKIIVIHWQGPATLRNHGYNSIINLKIGDIGAIQMVRDGGDDHVQQFASVCFSKKRLSHIE